MAASRDSETHIWLLNKLGTSNDTWVGGSIWSHFNVDVLRNIEECFATKNLPAQVKLKVLLSIFQMPRRNLDEWRDELEGILKIAMEDTDPWVSMIAEFMKPYPSSGALNMEIAAPGENKEMFDSLLEEIRDVVSSTADSTDLTPLDAVFLNHTSLNAAYGPAKSPQKHFSLKKKTKASQLKTELIAKSTEAASQTKRSSVTTVPVRTRGMPRKMTDKTPLKSLPSYHRPAASSAAHRPIGRPPLQKEGGIKLLDITEQPMGHGLAKKKRKAELEEQPPVPGGSTSPLAKKPPLPAGPGAEFPPPPSVGPPSVMPFQEAPKQGGPPSLAPPQTPDYTGLLSPLAHPPATPLNSYLPPTPLSVYSNPIPTPGSVDLFPPPPTPQGIPPSDSALPHPPTSEFVAPAPSETPPQPPPPVMYGAPPPTPHVQPLPQAEDRKPPPPYSAHLLPPTPAAQSEHPPPAPAPPAADPSPAPAQQGPPRKGLSLTREQMQEAQEMFRSANKVTRPEKALILGFMAGSRDNPCPHLGSIVTIKLSEGPEQVQKPDGTVFSAVVETHFQMNYATGEWKRIKKLQRSS